MCGCRHRAHLCGARVWAPLGQAAQNTLGSLGSRGWLTLTGEPLFFYERLVGPHSSVDTKGDEQVASGTEQVNEG